MVETKKYLLYDELFLPSSGGMLTIDFLPPIPSGRTVQFRLPGGGAGWEIYTLLDGELSGPFCNGSRLDTPVRRWEKLVARPHESLVLVVDLHPFSFTADQLNLPPLCLAVDFAHGEVGQLHLSPRLAVSIRCRHPRQLVQDWISGLFFSPEEEAAHAFADAAAELLPRMAAEQLATRSPAQAAGSLAAAAPEIARAITARAKQALPWMEVTRCALDLPVTNIDEITQKVNRPFEIGLETRKKVMDAVLAVYTRETFSPQIAQVLLGYAQANPGATEAELTGISQKLLGLSQQFSPQQILATSVQMGLIPPPTSGKP